MSTKADIHFFVNEILATRIRYTMLSPGTDGTGTVRRMHCRVDDAADFPVTVTIEGAYGTAIISLARDPDDAWTVTLNCSGLVGDRDPSEYERFSEYLRLVSSLAMTLFNRLNLKHGKGT